MITTTWQEAGFPDITFRDYGVPMFVLSNAALEYNYMLTYKYDESARESYLRSNCIKRLVPSSQDDTSSRYGLWKYAGIDQIINSRWEYVYLFSIMLGDYDPEDMDKSAVIREWTGTPTGCSFFGGDTLQATYYFLAEAARQAYMILSGPLYCQTALTRKYDYEQKTVELYIDDDELDWYNTKLVNPQYRIAVNHSSGRHSLLSGTRTTLSTDDFSSALSLVCGNPRYSYWVGKRISN